MSKLKILSEADNLDRMIRSDDADMPAEAARALLQLKLDAESTKAIDCLLQLNAAGTISADDRLLL